MTLAEHQVARRRQKRTQVARACDECRLRRRKCDNKVPCSNCTAKGRECSSSGAPKASTLTQASDEIEWLKQRVRQLEAELEQRSDQRNNPPTPIGSSSPSQVSSYSRNNAGYGYGYGDSRALKKYWAGIQLRPARSSNDAWLGSSSLHSFIQRLSVFLSIKLQETHTTLHLLPISASDSKLLDMPAAASDADPVRRLMSSTGELSTTGVYLSPIQEEYFINLFWQTYHTSLSAILDETQFKAHYQSLWVAGGKERRQSALVDIIIAMCMQYGISALPLDTQGILVEGKDALVAGRWHYWRGQTLLTYELESPSISTLQCHMLCAVYLCGGSFHNMMDNAVGQAVRTAYTLGLHIEPPSSMSNKDREMRRRLWWAVYLMDSKAGMKLGRPFMLHDSHIMPQLPSDSFAAARASGSAFTPISDQSTWLSFNLHQTTLYMKARAAYTSFYGQDLHLRDNQTLWDDPHALQVSAEVLTHHIQALHEWTDNVPSALKLKRQNNGTSLSTDGTRLSIEQFAPLWLQRQRVLLELTYHHLSVNLYRPLISFSAKPPPGSRAEAVAIRCASHAIMLSCITQQVLAESSILDGWHEAFHYQWNAAMTLVAFVVVYPHASLTAQARSAIDLAVTVFDNFGAKFAVAANAAKIVRDLCVKVDLLAKYSQESQSQYDHSQGLEGIPMDDSLNVSQGFDFDNNNNISSIGTPGDGNFDSVQNLMTAPELDLFDMAVDLDFWNSLDTLWPERDDFSKFQTEVSAV
ncbi:putative Zn(II)2Cys6 transcription factor [Aspergillus cavernicola]|uniref:Zn(II)2Cys6 transcription factor n=1 Tax=Aspergillus cavernicola TaxID=176166 RepID=A0ABR4IJ42_9EURO